MLLHRSFPRPLRLLVVYATALAAIGCGGGPAPEMAPQDAAEHVASLLLVDESTEACLEQKFTADPNVAAALNVERDAAPSSGQVDALKVLLRQCVSPEAQADLYATVTTSAFPEASPNAVECVRTSLLEASPADQDTLLVGALSPAQEGLAFSELLTEKVLDPCGLANFLPTDTAGLGIPFRNDTDSTPAGDAPPASTSGTAITR